MLFSRARRKKSRIWLTSIIDAVTAKTDDSIVLVAKRTYGYSGNLRVVGDYLAHNSSKAVYLYYEGQLNDSLRKHLKSTGICHLDTFCFANMKIVVSAKTLVVDHSIRDCYITAPQQGRKVINLWHGVPIKRIEMAIPGIQAGHLEIIAQNAGIYDLIIASSRVDQMAISSTFHVPYYKVIPSGLPRYDLFFADFHDASDLAAQQRRITEQKGKRKLLLYAPTFRQNHPSPCIQNQKTIRQLAQILEPLGFQLGIRTHQYDKSSNIFINEKNIVSYSTEEFCETNIVLRNTDILITDFSSLWVDFLLMDKPILGFATDIDVYMNEERNFLYDLNDVFPGPFLDNENDLFTIVKHIISEGDLTADYQFQKKLFLPKDTSSITENVCKAILAF